MQRDGQRKQYQMTKLETQNRKLQEMNKRKTEQASFEAGYSKNE